MVQGLHVHVQGASLKTWGPSGAVFEPWIITSRLENGSPERPAPMTVASDAAFYARHDACSEHRKSLPEAMKDECHFFFWASEYNRAHETEAQSSARDRRLAREFFQLEKDVGKWPQPLARHCERILATDRNMRVTRIRERRHETSEAVLPRRRAIGAGDIIPFPTARQAAARQSASA